MRDAYSAEPTGDSTGLYFTAANSSDQPDTLVSAQTSVAGMAMIDSGAAPSFQITVLVTARAGAPPTGSATP